MNEYEYWPTVLSMLGGSGVSATLARIIIGRSLNKLDGISDRLSVIEARLSAIDVHIKDFLDTRRTSGDHDKKMVEMDTRLKILERELHARRNCDTDSEYL